MAQLKASTVKTEEKGGGPHHHSCTQPLDTALTEFTMLIKTAGPSLFFLTSSTNTPFSLAHKTNARLRVY